MRHSKKINLEFINKAEFYLIFAPSNFRCLELREYSYKLTNLAGFAYLSHEEKATVVAAVWGTDLYAALANTQQG